jgi:hypothetical protein
MVCPSYGDCDAEEQDDQLTDCAEDGGVFGYVVFFGGIGGLFVGRWRCSHAIWDVSLAKGIDDTELHSVPIRDDFIHTKYP